MRADRARRRSTPLEALGGEDVAVVDAAETYVGNDAAAIVAPVYTRMPAESAPPSRPRRERTYVPEPEPARQDPSELAAGVRTVLILLLVLSIHSASRYAIRGALTTGAISQQQATVLTLAYPVVVLLLLWGSAAFVR